MLLNLKEYKELRSKGEPNDYVLVIDGDWLCYHSMSAVENEVNWGDDRWTIDCDHSEARRIVDNLIADYSTRRKEWKDAAIVLAFTADDNWRKDISNAYKASRAGTRKPCGYWEFIKGVQHDYTSLLEPTLEGDDIMGIIGSNSGEFNYENAVLVSVDKDFKTIPNCQFYWLTTGNILTQTEHTADYWHIFQTLKGDITDGYTGVPSMGEETTVKFLEEPYGYIKYTHTFKSGARKGLSEERYKKVPKDEVGSLWDCIVSIADKNGMSEEDVIKQGQLARILRWQDYDLIEQQIHLWKPSVSSCFLK